MMLPPGASTVAALLRGSLRVVPGNHVSGAAVKLAPTSKDSIPAKCRRRITWNRLVFITAAVALYLLPYGQYGIDRWPKVDGEFYTRLWCCQVKLMLSSAWMRRFQDHFCVEERDVSKINYGGEERMRKNVFYGAHWIGYGDQEKAWP
jgi:hypothetical protein